MRDIEGMSVLVTGGGSGIGEGIARHLCSKGALVTISGRRADKVQAVAASIGPACRAVVGDVTVDADRRAMVAAAIALAARSAPQSFTTVSPPGIRPVVRKLGTAPTPFMRWIWSGRR